MNLSKLKAYGIDPGQAHRIMRDQSDLCDCGQRKILSPDKTQESKVDKFEDEKRIFLQCWFPLVESSDECANCRMLRRKDLIEGMMLLKYENFAAMVRREVRPE